MGLSKDQFKKAVTSPIPKSVGLLELAVIRKTTIFTKIIPKFYLYNSEESVFLLNTKRKLIATSQNYHIVSNKNQFSKESHGYVGKLKGTFSKGKTTYIQKKCDYDNRFNIIDRYDIFIDKNLKDRLWNGEIHYYGEEDNPTSAKIFRMHMPSISDDQTQYITGDERSTMNSKNLSFQTFESVKPYYDSAQKRYIINYSFKTEKASSKVNKNSIFVLYLTTLDILN